MKLLTFIATIFLVITTSKCFNDIPIDLNGIEEITMAVIDAGNVRGPTFLQTLYSSNCDDKGEVLENAVIKMKECYAEEFTANGTVCDLVNNRFYKCSEPAAEVLEKCFSEPTKYFPKFSVKILESILKHMCTYKNDILLELVNPCVDYNALFTTCHGKIAEAKGKVSNPNENNKETVCGLINAIKSCNPELTAECNNQLTKDALTGWLDVVAVECKA